MRLFIIYLNISMCFGQANIKNFAIYYREPKTWAIIGEKPFSKIYPTTRFHLQLGSATWTQTIAIYWGSSVF